MDRDCADFTLLLRIREIRAEAAARSLSSAERLLDDAEQREAVASHNRADARRRMEASRLDHDPSRRKHINGRELRLGVAAVTEMKAALDDASRHHDAAISDVRDAEFNYQEKLRNFRLRQKSVIKTEATLDVIHADD